MNKFTNKTVGLLLVIAMTATTLTACSNNDTTTEEEVKYSSQATQAETLDDDASEGVGAQTSAAIEYFSDRDNETEYNASECETIELMDGSSESSSSTVKIDGDTVTITSEGVYIITGALTNGQIIINAAGEKVQLVLDGCAITNDNGAAIYVEDADKVFITTTADSENGIYSTISDESEADAAICSSDDLTLNGKGSLTVQAINGHGIKSTNELTITSGNYDVTADLCALRGKDSVAISDGTFLLNSGTDGIHSENSDDSSLGIVYIKGGNITINSSDDGIHGEAAVEIVGGSLNIINSFEGIEAMSITFSGGITSVISSDDGINASDGNGGGQAVSGVELIISGGELNVNAGGDGLDSNGSLYITGGTTTVSGPTDNRNGSLDFNGESIITGGTLMVSGSSGMIEQFSENSTQSSIIYGFDTEYSAGTEIMLYDANGNELVSYASEKSFTSVTISSAALEQGSAYTLIVDGDEYEVMLDSLNYSNVSTTDMGGGAHGNGPKMG